VAATQTSEAELDEIAGSVIARLGQAGFCPPARAAFPSEGFHRVRDLIVERFQTPDTTMTNLACRVLYGLAWASRPETVLGLGTFVGYAAAWLFAPGLPALGAYRARRLIACDIDPDASELARRNFSQLPGGGAVEVRHVDADRCVEEVEGPIDLLFLDVDSPSEGKAGYARLLLAIRPKLASGALVVAHDITHPWFQADLSGYRTLVKDRSLFTASATLGVDPCGLEVTMV